MKQLLLTTALLYFILSSHAQLWEQLNMPTTKDIVSSSFVSDTEGWIGFEGASSTITLYHTTDGGESWSHVGVPGSSSGPSYVCFVSPLTGYVVISGKAYKTVNGGLTWAQILIPGVPTYEPFFLNVNTGFIAGTGEVYKTIDGGTTWIAYHVGGIIEYWDLHFLNDSTGFGAATDGYMDYTTDGGESWEFSGIGGLCEYFFAVYYHPDGYLTYTGYNDDLGFCQYRSFIGGTANSLYADNYSSEVIGKLYDLKWFDSDRGYAAGEDGVIVSTEDGGQTWNEANLCELFNLSPKSLLALDGFETVYAFGEGGRGFKNSAQCAVNSQFHYTVDDLTVQFTDQSVNATEWLWDFGDGTTITLQNPVHTYSKEALYNVCLIASNDSCGQGYAKCENILICASNSSQNAAGSLDSTFSEDGIAAIHFEGFYSECRSLAIQSDHKVIGLNTGYGSEVIRYQFNGLPDSTFNTDGIAELNEDYNGEQVKLNSSGRILVAGGNLLSGSTISITSFNPDGSLTLSFGNDGIATIDPVTSTVSESFIAMEVLPDDKILLLTRMYFSGHYVQITKLKGNGFIDSSFAINGIANLDSDNFTFHNVEFGGLAAGPDGKIIVAGKITSPLNKIAVACLNADGTMNSTFGDDGFIETDLSPYNYDYATDVAIQADGKIVVVGNTYQSMAILRYNVNGSLDHTFGINGILKLKPGNNKSSARGVAIQPDGKILVCGYSDFNSAPTKILLVKLNTDGSYDHSFGNNGFIQTSLNCEYTSSFDMALDEDKIYVGGVANLNDPKDFCMIRYNNESCAPPNSLAANNITSSSAKLTWNEGSQDDRYNVRYKPTGTSTWTTVSTVVNVKKIPSLIPETKYVWQVKTICSDNPIITSDWSAKQFFTTASLKSVGEIDANTLEVYPNPFTTSANIQLSIATTSFIKIDLLDLQGRKLRSIAQGDFAAGNYNLDFSAKELPGGVYLLQAQVNKDLQILKIIIQ